ncbi:unnamed protein product [Brassica rapa]|uniref:Uncharacterized protein n=2 Tax=Brassica TaxID=3705 RepID=A0A8D9GUB1_BRACM|nr:unnamed protein product [Brassica napus]CAG7887053.1 unnamed protein product [Brassica rapa]
MVKVKTSRNPNRSGRNIYSYPLSCPLFLCVMLSFHIFFNLCFFFLGYNLKSLS